jgi:hypothetical protein
MVMTAHPNSLCRAWICAALLSCSAAVDVHLDADEGWIPVDSYVL